MTLPIGGRIALPSSINTYISVVKNTSLMYVIGYAELTTTALNISTLTLETLEALTVLGDRLPRARLDALGRDPPARVAGSRSRRRASDARLGRARLRATSSRRGCRARCVSSAIAVVGSAVIGVLLGTLMTIDFRPLAALIRLYIEVFRGLPILVTVFIVYFGLPPVSQRSSSPR